MNRKMKREREEIDKIEKIEKRWRDRQIEIETQRANQIDGQTGKDREGWRDGER